MALSTMMKSFFGTPAPQGEYVNDVFERSHNPGWKAHVSEGEPKVRFMIAAMRRSGSNFLTRQIYNSGLGYIGEFYLPDSVQGLPNAVGAESVSDPIYSDWIKKYRQTPNGVLSIKNHWDALENMPQQEREAFENSGKFIFTRRRDFAMQAISWERSHKTGIWDPRWGVNQPTIENDADPTNLDRLLARTQQIFREEGLWLSYFNDKGIQPHEIYYEDMIRRRDRSLRKVYRYLGVEAQLPAHETPPKGKASENQQFVEVAAELHKKVKDLGLVRPQLRA